jgi:hypothetical protein
VLPAQGSSKGFGAQISVMRIAKQSPRHALSRKIAFFVRKSSENKTELKNNYRKML